MNPRDLKQAERNLQRQAGVAKLTRAQLVETLTKLRFAHAQLQQEHNRLMQAFQYLSVREARVLGELRSRATAQRAAAQIATWPWTRTRVEAAADALDAVVAWIGSGECDKAVGAGQQAQPPTLGGKP